MSVSDNVSPSPKKGEPARPPEPPLNPPLAIIQGGPKSKPLPNYQKNCVKSY